MEYTELDKTTQINAIRNRIRDLESQHFQLSLRVRTPDLNQPVSGSDTQNVTRLETSLGELRTMLKELETPASPTE